MAIGVSGGGAAVRGDIPDPRILSQLLAAVSMLQALPSVSRLAEFALEVLRTVYGGNSCSICMRGLAEPLGDIHPDECTECRPRPQPGDLSPYRCALLAREDVRTFPLLTLDGQYGHMLIGADAAARFSAYDSFVMNFANSVAISLESRWRKEQLEQSNEKLLRYGKQLQTLVAKRTAELEAANAKLEQEIDERKQAEQEVRELNTELERRVAQRTAELEAANKELESFSYSVSHDLRAPLRRINGFSGIIREDYAAKLDGQGLRYLDQLCAASEQMGQLIEALLALSRVSRQELERRDVDVSGMVREIAAELAQGAPQRRVNFRIAENVAAHADPVLLRTAIGNLVENAWKYSANVAITNIEFGVAESDGVRAYFIRDNGAGFDMSFARKLFGAFQRLHRADEFAGTGVGLATVQRIVHRHGGRIWADAKVGHGATFYFTLG